MSAFDARQFAHTVIWLDPGHPAVHSGPHREAAVSIPEAAFDEAGKTGAKLLDSAQPCFALASVHLSDEEASTILEPVIGRRASKRALLLYCCCSKIRSKPDFDKPIRRVVLEGERSVVHSCSPQPYSLWSCLK